MKDDIIITDKRIKKVTIPIYLYDLINTKDGKRVYAIETWEDLKLVKTKQYNEDVPVKVAKINDMI